MLSRISKLEKIVKYLYCYVKNNTGGGNGEVPDLNLQQVTDNGNVTTNSIESTSDLKARTIKISSPDDPNYIIGTIKADNLSDPNTYQLPDNSGTFALITDVNSKLGGSGSIGQVPYFISSNVVVGTSDFYWDNTNKRLGVGVTSPTSGVDTTTLRVRNLPQDDGTFTNVIVVKSDGTFGYSSKMSEIPKDFFIAGATDIGSSQPSQIIYKTDIYRNFNLSELIGITVTNINEIIRNDNDFYITINYNSLGTTNQRLIALRGCYLEGNILKATSFQQVTTSLGSVHSLIYNPTDGLIYLANRIYSATASAPTVKIVKYNPSTLNVIATSNFPSNFINSTTDIKIFNNKLYFTIGEGSTYRLIELSTNLQDYTEIYSGTSNQAVYHIANTPFEIYNGKAYLPCYDNNVSADRQTNMKIVEFDLITRMTRISSKIILNNTVGAVMQTHWLTVYADKILVTALAYGAENYFSALVRIDIKTLLKEEELSLDMPVTDDNSIYL